MNIFRVHPISMNMGRVPPPFLQHMQLQNEFPNSCFARILDWERGIIDHLAEHHSLSNCQWGSQFNQILLPLISTTHDWLKQCEAGNEIGAIFFDFDWVPHQFQMSKLMGLALNSSLYCSFPPHIAWV